jgi:hypothetical protein
VDDVSSSSYTGYSRVSYSDSYTTRLTCPSDWLDINKNLYQISKDRKTIQEARSRCINFSQNALANVKVPSISSYHSYNNNNDDDQNEMMNISKTIIINTLKGEIVQYTYEWETRLGFYLLDQSEVSHSSEFEYCDFYQGKNSGVGTSSSFSILKA